MKLLPSSVVGDLLGFRLALEVAGLELATLAFELLLVGLVGAQRLALRQQEVAGEAVLDLDGVAHLAEAGNAFEKNDFHWSVPLQVGPGGPKFWNRQEARAVRWRLRSLSCLRGS